MKDFQHRARNALLGLAVGDAIGWPAMFHRSWLLPPWPRRIRREMDAEREGTGVLRVPMPFSLNQRSEVFDLGPTDDTEWAAWTMEHLLRNGCNVEEKQITDEWLALARSGQAIRGGVGTLSALENLRRGLLPPACGNDHPHYFDDGAACRAVPIGIASRGIPALASRGAAMDASVTNAEDGIWVAQAIASAVTVACGGGPVEEVIAAALGALPDDSWARRSVERALERASHCRSALELLPALDDVLNKEYSDGSVGPETLALTLAIISRAGGRFSEAVTAAAAFAKGADSVPALTGALAAALDEDEPIPLQWEKNLSTLKGISIPGLAGRSYLTLVDQFTGAIGSLQLREDRP